MSNLLVDKAFPNQNPSLSPQVSRAAKGIANMQKPVQTIAGSSPQQAAPQQSLPTPQLPNPTSNNPFINQIAQGNTPDFIMQVAGLAASGLRSIGSSVANSPVGHMVSQTAGAVRDLVNGAPAKPISWPQEMIDKVAGWNSIDQLPSSKAEAQKQVVQNGGKLKFPMQVAGLAGTLAPIAVNNTSYTNEIRSDVKSVGAKVGKGGVVTLYHATSPESAKSIIENGVMKSREPGAFFSTKPDGQISGYGGSVVKFQIPLKYLSLDDLFSDEAHLKLNVRGLEMDVSGFKPELHK